jgi:hypothetical protein
MNAGKESKSGGANSIKMQLTIGRKTHQISSNSQTLIETVKMS